MASALFEARLAHVELLGARNEPGFGGMARRALSVATTRGHFASARLVRELATDRPADYLTAGSSRSTHFARQAGAVVGWPK